MAAEDRLAEQRGARVAGRPMMLMRCVRQQDCADLARLAPIIAMQDRGDRPCLRRSQVAKIGTRYEHSRRPEVRRRKLRLNRHRHDGAAGGHQKRGRE